MIAAGHTAVGVIVGAATYQILGQAPHQMVQGQGDLATGLIAAGIAGVVSHYLTDFIPHGHFVKPDKLKKVLLPIIIFDLLLPIFLFLGLTYLKSGFNERLLYIMFGIGGAQLPDVLDGLFFINILKDKGLTKIENNFHQGLHWHGRDAATLLLGFRDIWQVLTAIIAIFII